jgi:hypothetical protein
VTDKIKISQTQRRPPSKLIRDEESSIAKRIEQISRFERLPEDDNNGMVFLRNEKMIYF